MNIIQVIGLFFAILGIVSSIFGIQFILMRSIRKELHDDIDKMKNEIMRKMKPGLKTR